MKRVIVGDVIKGKSVVVVDTGEVVAAKERGGLEELISLVRMVRAKPWGEGDVVYVPEEITGEVGGKGLWELVEHEVFKAGGGGISGSKIEDIFFSGGVAPIEGLLVGRYEDGVVRLIEYSNTTEVRMRGGRMFVDRMISWYNNRDDCGCYTGREVMGLWGREKGEYRRVLEKVTEEEKEIVRGIRARVVGFGL